MAVLAGIAISGGYRFLMQERESRHIAEFLAQHWAQPIAPQGDPPPTHTPAEASLAPQACGVCHPQQLADWSGSLHSRAIGPGILWQLRTFDQQQGNECLRCHAPLAEQKALFARELGWPNAPASPPPGFVPEDLHQSGLVCAACHVRRHQRFGPPPRPDAPPAPERKPHNGFTAEPAFGDSRFCAPCHQFPPEGKQANGKLLENTYEEWRASRYAKEGRHCQSCHMPDRRHLWKGVHDPQSVEQALEREITVTRVEADRIRVSFRVANRGAGHYLPTYVVPKIFVRAYLIGRGTHMVVGSHVIGRTLDLSLEKELTDTRLAPDAAKDIEFDVQIAPGTWRIVLRTEVAPAEHYERMFADALRRHRDLDQRTQELLQLALDRAVASRYPLKELTVTAPETRGASQHAVAN